MNVRNAKLEFVGTPRQALSRNLPRSNFGVRCPRFGSAPSQPTVGGSFRGWCGAMFMLRSVVTPPNDGGVTRGFFNNKLGFIALLGCIVEESVGFFKRPFTVLVGANIVRPLLGHFAKLEFIGMVSGTSWGRIRRILQKTAKTAYGLGGLGRARRRRPLAVFCAPLPCHLCTPWINKPNFNI